MKRRRRGETYVVWRTIIIPSLTHITHTYVMYIFSTREVSKRKS